MEENIIIDSRQTSLLKTMKTVTELQKAAAVASVWVDADFWCMEGVMLSTQELSTCPKRGSLDADLGMDDVTRGNSLEKRTAGSGH